MMELLVVVLRKSNIILLRYILTSPCYHALNHANQGDAYGIAKP